MHFEQLEYILEVAKRGTISSAAETLHVSHSAISQAISNLESELGIPIFKRSRAGSICTEEGKTVLKLSYDIMNKITELKNVGQKASLMKGNLSISSSPIFFSTVLPEALYAFKNEYPNIQIEINEDSTENIIASIKNYQLDLGFIFGSDETFKSVSQHLTSRSIYQPKLMVSVSKHSLLANKEVIYPKDMLQYPLIIRNEKFAKEVWEKIFSSYGKGQVLFYSNNDDVIKNVIANNLAIGFSTDLMKHDPLIKNGDIIMIPYVDNKNNPILHLICIQTKNKNPSIIEKEFINSLITKINSF
ncbi:LysR family transcriptional regulator [Peribacillus kribbensis]|uniref:LysR family transcriptional regulator n=1 Tax=Peribacillus kribbensis TaxID=356658 RepID=UPI00041754E3|nr:LysR family transcriptional regulator [Peribacillus kribbensis]